MTAIAAEIERFNRLSATWWDSRGPMRPLHVVNALRFDFIVEQIASHWGQDRANALIGLNGLRILDVGCGGGLMSEALARFGANVVGVDASPGNVAAARLLACTLNRRTSQLTIGSANRPRYCPHTSVLTWFSRLRWSNT